MGIDNRGGDGRPVAIAVVFLMFAAILFLFTGCAPISDAAVQELVKSMADKSGCLRIVGGAGGGAMVPGAPVPVVPMSGGYGSLLAAHAAPGANVKVNDLGCEITTLPEGVQVVAPDADSQTETVPESALPWTDGVQAQAIHS